MSIKYITAMVIIMIGQYYTIALERPDAVEPGYFVCDARDLDTIIGFVYDVEGLIAEMVLFEPQELPELTIQVLTMKRSWDKMLNVALSRAPDNIIERWADVFNDVDLDD